MDVAEYSDGRGFAGRWRRTHHTLTDDDRAARTMASQLPLLLFQTLRRRTLSRNPVQLSDRVALRGR